MSTLRRTRCFSGLRRMVTYLALCDRFVVATGPLPQWGGHKRHLAANVISLRSCLRLLVPALVLNMGT